MEDVVIEPITLDILQGALLAAFENPIFIILALTILADIATGWAKNKIYETGNSSAGIKGLTKHSTVLFICLIASFSGVLLQSKLTLVGADVIIALFAFEYIKSIAENFGVMGFKYPSMLTAKVEQEIAEKTAARDEARKLKEERKATE